MTQPAITIANLLKRTARITAVALCTASTLAMIGATAANAGSRKAVRQPAVVRTVAASIQAPAAKEVVLPQLAAFVVRTPAASNVELLKDDTTPALPASPAPRMHTVRMEVTAYCPCVKCCGPNAQGITASGKLVTHNGGRFVAADTGVLPFGTRLVIPGYAGNEPVEVADRGGAIKGNKLDLYFPSHAEALLWGRQMLEVTVYE